VEKPEQKEIDMKHVRWSCALGTAWLLATLLDPSRAQTPGRPVVVSPAPTPAAAAPAVPVVLPPNAIAPPPGPRPTLSFLPVEQTIEPPPVARLGNIVPVTYLPVQQPAAPAPADRTVTLSEQVVITSITEDTKIVASSAVTQPTASARPAATALPPSGMAAAFPRAEPAPSRKSFVDLSASPCFAHAPDYNWIYGRVEYSSVAKEWRLRYASVDETDRYGGRVSLIENHHVGLLQEGMYVHVRGHLVNPENNGNGPTFYRIEWYQTIENPNAEQDPSINVVSGRTK
jgi:hypothetical protein